MTTLIDTPEIEPEPPYGPGALCGECGHFAARHDETGCHGIPAIGQCTHGAVMLQPCTGMVWNGVRWPDPQGRRGYVPL